MKAEHGRPLAAFAALTVAAGVVLAVPRHADHGADPVDTVRITATGSSAGAPAQAGQAVADGSAPPEDGVPGRAPVFAFGADGLPVWAGIGVGPVFENLPGAVLAYVARLATALQAAVTDEDGGALPGTGGTTGGQPGTGTPTDPSTPTLPTTPAVPTDPTTPAGPTDPTDPGVPSDPTTPTSPGDPTVPTAPESPTTPPTGEPSGDPSTTTGTSTPPVTTPSGGAGTVPSETGGDTSSELPVQSPFSADPTGPTS